MEIINIDEASHLLGISKASLKNWEKHGYIQNYDKGYNKSEALVLKDKIEKGEISRLYARANKTKSQLKFIPDEYIDNKDSIGKIIEIVNFINKHNIKTEQAIFLLAFNLMVKNGDIDIKNMYNALNFDSLSLFKRESVYHEFKDWFSFISNRRITEDNEFCRFLLFAELPNEKDILGIIYQSIINEGLKSTLGSYYTPERVVNSMIEENYTAGKILDPCCGTGQFLLAAANYVTEPHHLWGFDIDSVAVRIARVNLFLKYIETDFKPNIFVNNSLLELKEYNFSMVATNPPWGAKFSKDILKKLRDKYPEISSSESFSYFLNLGIQHLEQGGVFTYLLPESVLYIKNHSDIRSYILNNCSLQLIQSFGRLFKNVFSSVVRIDGKKESMDGAKLLQVKNFESIYEINVRRFINNENKIINIYCNNRDQDIIDNIYSFNHITLRNNAKWALGIVTGNNKELIKSEIYENLEPLYKGRDILPLKLKKTNSYIEFNQGKFQQAAPEELYRVNEKLIYKFISDDLTVAFDDKKQLTLNSANIIIPELESHSVKEVGAILNSSVIRFIFKKKFNALKVLRSDLETLPFPLFSTDQHSEFCSLIDIYLNTESSFEPIDNYLFDFFKITKENMEYIKTFLNS